MTGKAAGLYCVSGTMVRACETSESICLCILSQTNQLAVRTSVASFNRPCISLHSRRHLQQPPHSVLLDNRAHIHRYEAGGIAFHSQATAIAVTPKNGHHLTLEDDILPNIVESEDVHEAPTRLICLENTCSGMIFPQDEVLKISEYCRSKGIKLHLDGARIWEASAKVCFSRTRSIVPLFDT
jgi:threonine aldolase